MAWEITTKELLGMYSAGERNFAGVVLIEDKTPDSRDCTGDIYGLEGADLRGINLRGANLQGVVLEGTNLSEANLFRACLCAADLSYAVLKRADLRSVNLMRVSCNPHSALQFVTLIDYEKDGILMLPQTKKMNEKS